MKTIILYFQVHQPFRLKRYRFFDIGNDHYYYDDYTNETNLIKLTRDCYIPTNNLLLDLIAKYPKQFKVAFSISGIALDQFELYAPEVIESFQELAKTGQVEFLAETYSHSLVSLKNVDYFKEQVELHKARITTLFGKTPTTFRNTELIYSDEIGADIAKMGFKTILTEGAKHILGWKSPNFLYCNAINPRLKVLLRNYKLSDDLSFRFSSQNWSEFPLTADKYVGWIKSGDEKEEITNIFLDYEVFGVHQDASTGIFEFLKALPAEAIKQGLSFSTPAEISSKLKPVSAIHVPNAISWADEERDLSAWLGNDLQNEAFEKLYDIQAIVGNCNNAKLKKDWMYLQSSDHFYYMCTKFFSDGAIHNNTNPYSSPYDAFINYMNVLGDFLIRAKACAPQDKTDQELANWMQKANEQEEEIAKLKKKIKSMKKKTETPKKASK